MRDASRLVRCSSQTVEGAEYYLGHQRASTAEQRVSLQAHAASKEEIAALGLPDLTDSKRDSMRDDAMLAV